MHHIFECPRLSRAPQRAAATRRLLVFAVVAGIASFLRADEPPKNDAPATPEKSDAKAAAPANGAPQLNDLYETGKALFETYAPAEIREQYEFPTKEQWDEFSRRLQHALDSDNLSELAGYLPEARTALVALRSIPGYEDYANWLEERIDYIEAAQQVATPRAPTSPETKRPAPAEPDVPYYGLWMQRVSARPTPERAATLMPILRAAFSAEGVPPELAWLAEVESTLNPDARSPAGAKGLFQLMPETAKGLGLSTMLPDERTNAEKSARAAAKYLKQLHAKFGSWPLAFAAYNAGEGHIERLLKQRKTENFSDISSGLGAETRMYVPKVCATIAVRTGVPVTALEPAASG